MSGEDKAERLAAALRAGRVEAALAEQAQALALSPDNPESHGAMAHVLWAARRRAKAHQALEMAVARSGRRYVSHLFDLAMLCLEAGEMERAIHPLSQALRVYPGSANMRACLAAALRGAGRAEDAERLCAPLPAPSAAENRGKLLLISLSSAKSGAGILACDAALGLAQAGFQVTFAAPKASLTDYGDALGSLSCLSLAHDPGENPRRSAFDVKAAEALLDAAAPNIVFISNGLSPLLAMAACEAARNKGIPYALIDLGLNEDQLPGRQLADSLIKPLRVAYMRAEAAVQTSASGIGMLRRLLRLPPELFRLIYPGRSEDFFAAPNPSVRQELRAKLGVAEDGFLVVCLGRLTPIKGHGFQLPALVRLQERGGPMPILAWVGQGSERDSLEARTWAEGINEWVRFSEGWDDPLAWLDAADALVLTSLSEGMPLAVLEALAKGLPVLGADVGGVREAMAGAGIVLPPPQMSGQLTDFLADSLLRLMTDGDLRHKLAEAAHKRAKIFRLERMIADMTLLAFQMMAKGRPA